MNGVTIDKAILEELFHEFTSFLADAVNETFTGFKNSAFVDEEENYKYTIYQEANRRLASKSWSESLIGTGEILAKVENAIIDNVIHLGKSVDNNVLNWRKKIKIREAGFGAELEELFFKFYKNRVPDSEVFQRLLEAGFSYQLIAYLFFIKDYNQFAPISQERFDWIFENKLQIDDFKTSRQASWDNYSTFLSILREVRQFLKRKDSDTTLLDAHSFLWILGTQREAWLEESSQQEEYPSSPESAAEPSTTRPDKEPKSKQTALDYGFWWVNHTQRHDEEIEGGFIWAPKKNEDGSFNQTYENLKGVKPGDSIISFANGQIEYIGVATKKAVEAKRPTASEEPGTLPKVGWLVEVFWEAVGSPFRPKEYILEIRPLLPERYSPLREDGNGNQNCYLARIDNDLGDLIRDLSNSPDDSIEAIREDVRDEAENDQEEEEIRKRPIPELTKKQLVEARRGQGIFKANLRKVEEGCRVTGVTDERFLVASHIKPWKVSNDDEKLDGNNGLLLAPHIDRLFDRGWMSFQDNGNMIIADTTIDLILEHWGLSQELNVGGFSELQSFYLAYHRKHVFRDRLT